MKKGFCFILGRKQVFIVSDYEKITEKLLSNILTKLSLPDNEHTRYELKYWLQKGTIEKRLVNTENEYYSIKGKNYSYSYPTKDNDVIIITVNK